MNPDKPSIPQIDIDTAQERMERIKAVYSDFACKDEIIDKLAYLAATMEQQRDVALVAQKAAEQSKALSYREGVKEGLRRFAWWCNGQQVVGGRETVLLSDAIKDVDASAGSAN